MLDRNKLHAYARLMRIDRPIGALLLLWPTLWALWISADGQPDPLVVTVFVLGVILMRSAGCVINDFADRGVDAHVKRTATRPLATGEVSSKEALALFGVLCLLAFGLVCLMNTLTIQLSLVAVVLAATYPFMKRYTYLPQVHLGAAFGWAVPMSFAAHTGTVSAVGWLLFVSVVVWAVAYDTMYAMVDRDDDLKIGVKSTAILFGDADRVWVGFFQMSFILILLLVGARSELSIWYYLGVGAAVVTGIYHQYLIRHRERDACFKAFLGNNWTGAVIFLGVLAHYLLNTGN